MCPAYGLRREIVPSFPLPFFPLVYFSRLYTSLGVETVVSAGSRHADTEKPLFHPVIPLSVCVRVLFFLSPRE